MDTRYRIVVGEVGNEQGHIVTTNAKTEMGAKRVLARELAEYDGDGWGWIEARDDGDWYEVQS
jgi:hypothetical protein